VGCFYPVVVRALSLFGPGELRALRVDHADMFRIILTMLDVHPSGGATTSQMAQALEAVCAIELASREARLPHGARENATAIIERCAATITELKGFLPGALLCEPDRSGHPPVLARCTRLEVLIDASRFTPAVWLGLSQLHTLHDVDLNQVSTATIAAALPRLHTLKAYRHQHLSSTDSASVSGFFTDLLPRLRVFHFQGGWPAAAAESATAPLPLLEELVWDEQFPKPTVLCGFLGARPVVLHVPCELINECLTSSGVAPGDPRSGLLARACELRVRDRQSFVTFQPGSVFDIANIARVLRAAPRLRAFAVDPNLHGDTSWLTASAAPPHPAFVGLVHPRLRLLSISMFDSAVSSCEDGCALRLRQTCFPRLRELEINRKMFFVEPAGG
jgi:hypothetical protein